MTMRVSAFILAMALAVSHAGAPRLSAQQPAAVAPSPAPAKLSDVDKLEADKLKLRAELVETQKALITLRAMVSAGLVDAEKALDADAKAFEARAVSALGGKAGETFDWSTYGLKPAPPAGGAK
jgi:hypothetical protein